MNIRDLDFRHLSARDLVWLIEQANQQMQLRINRLEDAANLAVTMLEQPLGHESDGRRLTAVAKTIRKMTGMEEPA